MGLGKELMQISVPKYRVVFLSTIYCVLLPQYGLGLLIKKDY